MPASTPSGRRQPSNRAQPSAAPALPAAPAEASVAGIYTAPKAGAPMEQQGAVVVVPEVGIVGDRYALGTGQWSAPRWHDQQLTLFEAEVADALGIEAQMVRRNIVTRGVALFGLIGVQFRIGEVDGRDCVIVDDEILTGGTVASSLQLLRQRGARSVHVGCVHPLFAARAYDLLDTDEIAKLVFTDSVPVLRPFQKVPTHTLSVAHLIGDAMHRIHTGGSVGELFL